MAPTDRLERLAHDLEIMRALAKASTIFEFEVTGDPPDRYTITFRGKGISRDTSPHSDVEVVELHRVDLRLPYSYPNRPPDVRWMTPIFHPNVSFSGFINVRDIGLTWAPDISLDTVCERLWDVARLAYLNLDKATNYAARNWYEDQAELEFPLDSRTLCDRAAPAGSNVIHYERRGERGLKLPEATAVPDNDVFFIGEDTPTPIVPTSLGRGATSGSDDDVLYIGDD